MDHIRVPKVENVKLVDRFNPRASPVGTLYLTTTHLIFVSSSTSASASSSSSLSPKKELWILHMLMHTVEKPMLTTSGTQLRVLCSHFQTATFIIQRDRDAHDVYQSLMALSKPKDVDYLYCFTYNSKGEMRKETGWQFHDLVSEFQRQVQSKQLLSTEQSVQKYDTFFQGVPNQNWSLCSLNQDYRLCPTYPRELFVPAQASQAMVEGSARFRSKGRLPVLTYLHRNHAAIVRCAQPLVGISGVRSSYDEKYVDLLRRATPGAPFIHVIDTRPAMNAIANRAGGKGYESDKYYENIMFSFKGIDNIHKMRASLRQVVAIVALSTSVSHHAR